ncbi:aldo/keto reductase [Methylophilaceae bacterium]|nr:aldo/keto reductase [Methylophilaceae bacterium]
MDNDQRGVVLIQSRLSSSRLPGKALLPIGDLPMVVLAAKRASNTGLNITILTSTDQSDDVICQTLEKFDIKYFRGSSKNVLKRFNDALVGLNDSKKVFRLTADNVLPDGRMLDEMEKIFDKKCPDILGCNSVNSLMPYGISAELTTVGSIRKAFINTQEEFDVEHVTPYIYRNGISIDFKSKLIKAKQNLRVTVDTFDDYLCVKSLFDCSNNPCGESINKLVNNFKKMKYYPHFDQASKPMTLGGAQFGLNYGVTNKTGIMSESESILIIKHAITEGIQYIDTAAAYGNSERVIGKALADGWSRKVKIITKLRPFNKKDLSENHGKYLPLKVKNCFLTSCKNLMVDNIDTFMLHRAEHLKYNQITDELIKLREESLINQIGVSVQSPDELEYVIQNKDVSLIQLPFNILDYRWESMIDVIRHERGYRTLIIHARSALLQGLLCSDSIENWLTANIKNAVEVISWLKSKYKQYGARSISDLCINFVNSQDWIDSVVIGVDDKKNLFSNLQSISMPSMSKSIIDEIIASRPCVDSKSLNPVNWRKNV